VVGTHEKERKQCMEEQGIFIERILSNENMNRAYKQVKKNKGAAGIDGMECADLFSHLKVATQREYKKSVIQTNASKESGNP